MAAKRKAKGEGASAEGIRRRPGLHLSRCPRCLRADGLKVTLVGYFGSVNKNRAHCEACGWRGIAQETKMGVDNGSQEAEGEGRQEAAREG